MTDDSVMQFAPITGAWIETFFIRGINYPSISHPLRVRGLKPIDKDYKRRSQFAPITGAWIETRLQTMRDRYRFFAPITGAWIETA